MLLFEVKLCRKHNVS